MNSSGRGLLSRRNEVFKTRITDSPTLHVFPFLVCLPDPHQHLSNYSFVHLLRPRICPMTEKMIFYLDSSVCIQFNPILNAVIWLQLCGKQKTFISKSTFSKEAWKVLRFSYSRLYLWLSWRLMEVGCKLIIIFYPWTRMRVVLLYHINEQTVTFKLSYKEKRTKNTKRKTESFIFNGISRGWERKSITGRFATGRFWPFSLNYFFCREGPSQ